MVGEESTVPVSASEKGKLFKDPDIRWREINDSCHSIFVWITLYHNFFPYCCILSLPSYLTISYRHITCHLKMQYYIQSPHFYYRARHLLREIDRALANKKEWMDSLELHAYDQRFPAQILRLVTSPLCLPYTMSLSLPIMLLLWWLMVSVTTDSNLSSSGVLILSLPIPILSI